MGLLRRVAKRVLKRATGDTPAPAAVPRPPIPPPEPASTGEEMANIECGAQELKERLDAGEPVTVLDVREPGETAGGVIAGAILIPLGQLQQRWKELENEDEIVCNCAHGMRSYQAATFLREMGLINATSLEGGIAAWSEIGGGLETPSE